MFGKCKAKIADRFVTIAVIDTNGLLRGQKVAARELAGILKNGMGMAPAQLSLDPTDVFLNVPGVSDDTGDFHDSPLAVDADSRRTLPWEAAQDSGFYLAQFTGDAAYFCPRSVLRRVLKRGADMGLHPKTGFEVEYTLFNETAHSLAEKDYKNPLTATAHPSHDLIIYQTAQCDYYHDVANMCDTLGIKVAKMHEEIGGGFMEVCISAAHALEAADQTVLLKNFLRVKAMRDGRTICYMPRWSEEADSQSTHVHVSLLDAGGAPVFWDANNEANMSETFRHFIGGLQAYLPEMMLVMAPTVNSWRRFAEGTFAPPAFSWGIENRTTAFRIVGHSKSSIRVENRMPGSDSNAHLVTAAILAAGFAGIESKAAPSEPTVGNGYIPEIAKGPTLPENMGAAIKALQGSAVAKDWLSERFVETYTSSRASQLESFKGKDLIDERRRFFELG